MALFTALTASGRARHYVGRTWALNGDEAYPLPPHAIWAGDISVLTTHAPVACRN
jgi:hypothetical protein